MLEHTVFDRFESGYSLDYKTLPVDARLEVERICKTIADSVLTTEAFAFRMSNFNSYTYLSVIHRIPGKLESDGHAHRGHNRVVTFVLDDTDAVRFFRLPFRRVIRMLLEGAHEHVPPVLLDVRQPPSEELVALCTGSVFYNGKRSQLFVEAPMDISLGLMDAVWEVIPYKLRKRLSFFIAPISGTEASGSTLCFYTPGTVIDASEAGKTDKYFAIHSKSGYCSVGTMNSKLEELGWKTIILWEKLLCTQLFKESISTFEELYAIVELADKDYDRILLAKALTKIDPTVLCDALWNSRLDEHELDVLLVCSRAVPELHRALCEKRYGHAFSESIPNEKPEEELEAEEDVFPSDSGLKNAPKKSKSLKYYIKESLPMIRTMVIVECIAVMFVVLLSLIAVHTYSTGQVVRIIFVMKDAYLLLKITVLVLCSFILGWLSKK